MKIIKKNLENRSLINISNIPIDSNLGLLAYGDVAFEAWRKLKMDVKLKNGDDAK